MRQPTEPWTVVTTVALSVAAVLGFSALAAPRPGPAPATRAASVGGPATTSQPAAGPARPPATTTVTGAPGTEPAGTSVTWVAPAPTTTPASPCQPADMSIATTTDATQYPAGAEVAATTTLRAERATCELELTPADGERCPSLVVIDTPSGQRVWPAPGTVSCASPAPQLVSPGAGDTITLGWDSAGATPGTYLVVGQWSWAAGPGQPPYVVTGPPARLSLG